MTANTLNKLFIIIGLASFIFGVHKANAAYKFWLVEYEYQLHLTLEIVLYLVMGLFVVAYNTMCIAFHPCLTTGIITKDSKEYDFGKFSCVPDLKLRQSGDSVASAASETSC